MQDSSTAWSRFRGGLAGLAALGVAAAAAGCGDTSAAVPATRPATPAAQVARWTPIVHVRRPLDLAGPRSDGSLLLAAAGRLFVLGPGGAVHPFASGPAGYRSPGGEEPYIALAPPVATQRSCGFQAGTVYALRLTNGRGVVAISQSSGVRRLARLNAPGLIDGIAFDGTGRFAHRLLVTINAGSKTTVDAIDCRGRVTAITRTAPRVEGGIAVAPASFGRFAGDLIAPGETSGRIFAVTPAGQSLLVADSGLPHGNDIGVESEGFVPSGSPDALVSDRLTPGNPHPGDDVVLSIGAGALRAAGVRQGDLLVATEGGALTDAIRCTRLGCRVRLVAKGPAVAHIEGHITFARP
ncbi:MAG: hypothetical protein JOZ98_06115 [Solirubrobacterales bacterium]|nr:hypothetical protein [Solirubrobacterales bacterium]MBV9801200.1 hypothetical protein [Solirubrobacterales bacterium]